MINLDTNGLLIESGLKPFTVLQITNAICDIIPKESTVLLGRDTRSENRSFIEFSIKTFLSRGFKVECVDLPIGISLFSFYMLETSKYSIGLYFTAFDYGIEYQGLKLYDKKGRTINKDTLKIIMEKANINFYASNITKRIKISNYYIQRDAIEDSYINKANLEYDNKTILHYSCGYGTGLSIVSKALKSIIIDEETKEQIIDQFTNTEKMDINNINAYIDSELCISLVSTPECSKIGIREYGKCINNHDLTALFLDYFIQKSGESMYKKTLYKNITTSMLSEAIAREYDIDVINTNRNISDISNYNTNNDFLFGADENSGFIFNSLTNEKCAISTIVILSKMIDYWRKKNTTLSQRLRYLKNKYLDIEEYTINKYGNIDEIIKEYQQSYVYVSRINGLTKMLKNNKKGLIYIEQSKIDKNKYNIYIKNLNK